MSYSYDTEKANLFTEHGVDMLTKIRDNCRRLLDYAGAFQAEKAWKDVSGSSWTMLACLDYLAEKGEIQEVKGNVWGQYRLFVRPHRMAQKEGS